MLTQDNHTPFQEKDRDPNWLYQLLVGYFNDNDFCRKQMMETF